MEKPTPNSPKSTFEPVSREALYEAVWSEPATRLATKYGVSDSFLARVCKRLRVPRPLPGYWAKKNAGKAPPRPPLPRAEPGDEIQWQPMGSIPPAQRTRLLASLDNTSAAPKPSEAATSEPGPSSESVSTGKRNKRPEKRVPATHPLIEGVAGFITEGRISNGGHYRPRKRLIPDILTSPAQVDTMIRFANKLYRHLESKNHRVRIATLGERFNRHEVNPRPPTRERRYYEALWHPERPTVVYIDTLAIGLTLFEPLHSVLMRYVHGECVPESKMSTASKLLSGVGSFTTERLAPSGDICLQAYSPYAGTDWMKQWRGRPASLADQFQEITASLVEATQTVRTCIEEARLAAEKRKREWDEAQERYRVEEETKRRVKAIETSRAGLLAIIEDWNQHQKIEAFFKEAITQLSSSKTE